MADSTHPENTIHTQRIQYTPREIRCPLAWASIYPELHCVLLSCDTSSTHYISRVQRQSKCRCGSLGMIVNNLITGLMMWNIKLPLKVMVVRPWRLWSWALERLYRAGLRGTRILALANSPTSSPSICGCRCCEVLTSLLCCFILQYVPPFWCNRFIYLFQTPALFCDHSSLLYTYQTCYLEKCLQPVLS